MSQFIQNTKEFIRRVVYKIVPYPYPTSFSQAGEDRVLNHLFRSMGIEKPSYLDLGANNPIFGNNTYLFYLKGGRGVCVEADPAFYNDLCHSRKKDKCLNIGVTFDERTEADFYIFSEPSLNTLSKEEADFREKKGSHKIVRIMKIQLKNINDIIADNFQQPLDLLSIDVEGIDVDILKAIDFTKHRPLAICAETITYSENRTEEKIPEIENWLTANGYFVYADTHINTIFVDSRRFNENSTIVKPS
jgi:FkbM family methyltransferase